MALATTLVSRGDSAARWSARRPELALPRTADHDFDPPEPGTYRLPPIREAGDGWALDSRGRRRRLRELFPDRVTLLSFVYTRCADPSACPYATAVLQQIHDVTAEDPELAARLQLLTFSFDPDHDTVPVMARYGAARRGAGGAEWTFLTTNGPAELEPILEAYGQRVHRKRDPEDRLGPLQHVLRVFLIDGEGVVRNVYSYDMLDPRLALADVRTLLLESAR